MCHPTISFPSAEFWFSNFLEWEMGEDCKNKVLVLVSIDFLPPESTSGCESYGWSQ